MSSALLLLSEDSKPYPPIPSREEVLGEHIHFMGGRVLNLSYGKTPWWPSALSWLSASNRQIVYQDMRLCGDTHAIIAVPSGNPLYNEYNQFYSPDKFGPLDWTNGLTSLTNGPFLGLVDEVIREGFKFIISMDEQVGNSKTIIKLVMEALSDIQVQYGYCIPGYDGVFYGWPISDIIEWASIARSIKPNCYLKMEFNPGHIPLGNGPSDYQPGGDMNGYDGLLGEFTNGSEPFPYGDVTWQVVGRLVRPYNRPPDQPVWDDPNPPFYLVDSERGPRYFNYFETNYPYYWVRVDMNNQSAIDNMINDIDAQRAYARNLGCQYTG